MAWRNSVLVVANITATSDQLLAALETRARERPSRFTLIVPATPFGGGRDAALEKLADAVERLRAAGLEAEGGVGNPDPVVAVSEVWDPKRFDEIIVSTLPMKVSKWLHAGLQERIARITGAPVAHVVSEPRPALTPSAAPEHQDLTLGPLAVLGWGARPE